MEDSYFDPKGDYPALHLDWIHKHTAFCTAQSAPHCSYFDTMRSLYYDMKKDDKCCACDRITVEHSRLNHTAYSFLNSDMRTANRNDSLMEKLNKRNIDMYGSKSATYFVTIGFNHQTFNVKSALAAVNNLVNKDFVISCKAVFEYYRTNGEHPHIHLIIEAKQMRAGMLVTKIFQSAGMSKQVLSRNFIDVKPKQEYHDKYIAGDKIPEKMACCEKDKKWREDNKIPHLIVKNI